MRTHKVTSLSIEPELLEAAKKRVEKIRPKTTFSAYIQQLIEMDLEDNAGSEGGTKPSTAPTPTQPKPTQVPEEPTREKVKAAKAALKTAKRTRPS